MALIKIKCPFLWGFSMVKIRDLRAVLFSITKPKREENIINKKNLSKKPKKMAALRLIDLFDAAFIWKLVMGIAVGGNH